jgi:nucleoid-associated protein YgaU
VKQVKILVVVGLCVALAAILLYLNDPAPPPSSKEGAPSGSSQIAQSEETEGAPAESQTVEQTASAPTQEQQEPTLSEADAPSGESAASQPEKPTQETASAEESAPPQPATQAPEPEPAPAETTQTAALPPPVKPTFDIVRVEKDGSILIAGRGAPGSEIEVLKDGEGGLAAAVADARGEFVALPPEPLAPGQYELRLRSREAMTEEWLVSDQSVVVVVPQRREGEESEPGEGVMTVLLSDDPAQPTIVMQRPEGLGLSSGDLGLEIIDYDEEGNLIIAGRAPAGARLFVYLDDEPLADTKADAGGRWNVIPDDPAPAGAHRLRVDQIGGDGKVVARVETRFYRAPGSEQVAQAASGEVKVEPGNSLWRIARNTYGRGIRYTLIYQANQEQIRDPDLIYPGQIFILPEDQGEAATQ